MQLLTCSNAQANKNLLVKVRAGTADVSLAAAFKAWWQPSLSFAASMAYDFASQQPRLGLNFNVENYGNIRCCSCHVRQSNSLIDWTWGRGQLLSSILWAQACTMVATVSGPATITKHALEAVPGFLNEHHQHDNCKTRACTWQLCDLSLLGFTGLVQVHAHTRVNVLALARRYERSQETQRMGKALVQRHVAQQHDMVNKSGEGLLVRQKDLNDPHILGQERPASDQYL